MPSGHSHPAAHSSGYQASSHSTSTSAQQSTSSLPHDAPSPPSKRDLATWWRQFKRNTKKGEEPVSPPSSIFGVPLTVSIKYANVAISLTGDDGNSFIYGYVPIVVAKCGVFLKEKATDVEGIFRLSGSAKRIKDLQEVFNTPDRFGKGLDWTGYTVHDAANVFRRYLNQLPEPIVPLEFYERFRDPLRHRQGRPEGDEGASQVDEANAFNQDEAVATYQRLIKDLPPLNRQLLLYILDLLTVFASKSDLNRMTATNLAAIFQPGMLSHPSHDMSPQEYRLSQDVLVFLIENQDNFLFGMTGTAADEQTVKDVQGGVYVHPPRSGVRRSASNGSGGAEGFRKYEALRRNMSVSSKHSRNSGGNVTSPTTPNSIAGGSFGVHRSNTVPSKRASGLSPAFARGRTPDASTPPHSAALSPTNNVWQPSSKPPSRAPSPATAKIPTESSGVQNGGNPSNKSAVATPPEKIPLPNPEPPTESTTPKATGTPTKERKLASLFAWSSPPEGERKDGRQPNRLKKKRPIPDNASESAQSSTHSLQGGLEDSSVKASTSQLILGLPEQPMDESHVSTPKVSNTSAPQGLASSTSLATTQTPNQSQSNIQGQSNLDVTTAGLTGEEGMLKPPRSRTPSPNSATDQSDLDDVSRSEKRDKRRSWRFHLTKKADE